MTDQFKNEHKNSKRVLFNSKALLCKTPVHLSDLLMASSTGLGEISLIHDNVSASWSNDLEQFLLHLQDKQFQLPSRITPPPPYSPYLSVCDFFLFPVPKSDDYWVSLDFKKGSLQWCALESADYAKERLLFCSLGQLHAGRKSSFMLICYILKDCDTRNAQLIQVHSCFRRPFSKHVFKHA